MTGQSNTMAHLKCVQFMGCTCALSAAVKVTGYVHPFQKEVNEILS